MLHIPSYRSADKSLARPTSRCILFDSENVSFVASLVIYIYVYIYVKLLYILIKHRPVTTWDSGSTSIV